MRHYVLTTFGNIVVLCFQLFIRQCIWVVNIC